MSVELKENIFKDKRLTAIFKGIKDIWDFNDDFLSVVLWHTDDFDLANEVIEKYMDSGEDMLLEMALFDSMTKVDFEKKCLNSDFLSYKICEKLLSNK